MIKLLFSLPRSGTGLCGAVLGIDKGEGGFISKPDNPKPMDYVLGKARKHDGLWTHYPYTERMETYLRESGEFACYVNLRDPRDIIVSYGHALERNPGWWWNYEYNGRRAADMAWEERIDALIDCMHDELYRHDNWRKSDICLPMRYSQNVNHPASDTFRNLKHKGRGVVGSHKDEMTPEQIEKANFVYGPLIEAWS